MNTLEYIQQKYGNSTKPKQTYHSVENLQEFATPCPVVEKPTRDIAKYIQGEELETAKKFGDWFEKIYCPTKNITFKNYRISKIIKGSLILTSDSFNWYVKLSQFSSGRLNRQRLDF